MAGTSAGARKGWLTRRGYQRFGGSAMHTRKQELLTVEESARLRKMRGQQAPKRQARANHLGAGPAPIAPARRPRSEPEYATARRRLVDSLHGSWDLPRESAEYEHVLGELRGLDASVPQEWLRSQTHSQATAPAPRATRPAPAAPAKSSTPVAGKRVSVKKRAAETAPYDTPQSRIEGYQKGIMSVQHRIEEIQKPYYGMPKEEQGPAIQRLRGRIRQYEAEIREERKRSGL